MKILGQNFSFKGQIENNNQHRVTNNNRSAMIFPIKMRTLEHDVVSFLGAVKELDQKDNSTDLAYLNVKGIDDIPSEYDGLPALVRVDHNVSFNKDKTQIKDDTRIVESLPTIRDLSKKYPIVLVTHIDDPNKIDKETGKKKGKEISTKITADKLQEYLKDDNIEVIHMKVKEVINKEVEDKAKNLKPGQILYLENIRFRPEETGKKAVQIEGTDKYTTEEISKEDQEAFAKKLAKLGKIYVNDGFGAAHRDHISTAMVAQYIEVEKGIKGPKVAGRLMQNEISELRKLLENPKRPYVAVVGGSKVDDKIKVLESLITKTKVDKIIIGGAMANTFTLAKNENAQLGQSKVERDKIKLAQTIINLANDPKHKVELILAEDCMVSNGYDFGTNEFKEGATVKTAKADKIPEGYMALDIGPVTTMNIKKAIKDAGTILWNGPMGVFESDEFDQGTKAVANAIKEATQNGAVSVLGGGDTITAINKFGMNKDEEVKDFTFVSTGGGASLKFVEKIGKLPAICALDTKFPAANSALVAEA